MFLEQLRLYNFRCYDQLEIEVDPRFNVIVGLNGQGKTSILEAIGVISFLRSFRNAKNAEILKLGTTEGVATGLLRNGDLSAQLAVKVWPTRKQATFNGKSCKYLSEYIGKVSAVSFSPTDLEIIRGSPENRRLWSDKMAQIVEPTHADAVLRYQKILEHRNRQLRNLSEGRIDKLPDDFEIWTEELSFWGAKIIHNRIHTVDKAVDKIRKFYAEISGEKADITIRYLSDIFDEDRDGQANQSSLELLAQVLQQKLRTSLQKEVLLGATMVGPHRDDLEISLNGHPFRAFGSQGEVRSVVLAMRLAEVELYQTTQSLNPILLIDDFSSELDAKRRKFLLEYLVDSKSQVFLTTTEPIRLGKTFLVNDGKINSPGHLPEHLDDNGYFADGHK